MEIRKLTESDYDQVIELYKALDDLHAEARPDCCVRRPKEQVYPKDAYLHNLAYPEGLELGAFDGTQLVGVLRATLWNESGMVKGVKTVCLDDIYVLPTHRRRGIAAKLFTVTEQWARAEGATRLDLHVWSFNADALALYHAMGMTPQRYMLEKKL